MNSDSTFPAPSPTSTTADGGRPRVFVTRRLPAVGLEMIALHFDAEIWPDRLPPSREALLQAVRGCSGLVTLLSDRIDAELFDAAGPDLRVVSNFAVGVNNIDLPEAIRRGIAVGNTPGVLTDATADMAVTLLLAAARHLKPASDEVRDGNWKTWEPTGWLGCDIAGKTLGIIGMGRIGAAVAARMAGGWNMNVLYTSRTEKQLPGVSFNTRVELDQLLAASDFVSIHTDLNEQSRGMIGRHELALMKPTAVLVNTSRGAVIDQKALAEALYSRQIFAAGLDVTEPEPLDATDPLVSLPNCIIAPHIASATFGTRDAMARICAENLIAGVLGKPLPATVC
jgi:glyoxylate reductase